MIDHYTLIVSDYEASKAFYVAALAPLGVEVVSTLTRESMPDLPFDEACGLGVGGKPALWLRPAVGETVTPTHIAFTATDRAAVDAFHGAALAAGASDHGKPGLRHYHPSYYAAFVRDPDGYNVEAVCHAPE